MTAEQKTETWYETWANGIDVYPLTVLSETPKTLMVQTKYRGVRRKMKDENVHPTLEAAHVYLLARAERRVQRAREVVGDAETALLKLRTAILQGNTLKGDTW